MDLYLGNASAHDYDFWGDPGPLVGQNIARQWAIHNAGFGQHPITTYAWIYCHEESLPRYDADKALCTPDYLAYTWTHPGIAWTAHYVVLCPNFWEVPSLTDLVSKADGDVKFQMDMNNWFDNRAITFLHEVYHWPNTVSIPQCGDTAGLPQQVCNLAYHYNTNVARLNAESYAEAAMAIYIMKTFHHSDVPTPGGTSFQPSSIVVANVTDDLSSDGPPDWESPVNTSWPQYLWEFDVDAALLSDFGDLMDTGYGDCQQNQTFWNLAQCEAFCTPAGVCAPSAANASWYECGACATTDTCYQGGNYTSVSACGAACVRGTCSYTPGSRNVTCLGCPCSAGSYGSSDECAAGCGPGKCALLSPDIGEFQCTC